MSKVFKHQLAWTSITQYAGYFYPVIVTPIVARSLGLENFATYAIVLAFIAIISALVEYSTNTVAVTFTVQKKFCTESIVSSVYQLKTILLIFILLIYILVWFLFKKQVPIAYVNLPYALPFVFGAWLSPSWYLSSISRADIAGKSTLICRIFIIPIMVCMVDSSDDLKIALLLTTLPNLLASCFLINQALKIGMPMKMNFKVANLSELFFACTPIYISTIAMQIYSNFPLFAIPSLLGNSAASQFAAADRVIRLISPLLAPLTTVLLPYTSQKNSSNHNILLLTYVAIGIIFCSGIFLSADWIVKILFSSEFGGSADIIKIYSLYPILYSINIAIGLHILVASGHRSKYFVGHAIGAFFSLVSTWYFIEVWGVNGVIAVILMVELLVLLVLGYFAIGLKKDF